MQEGAALVIPSKLVQPPDTLPQSVPVAEDVWIGYPGPGYPSANGEPLRVLRHVAATHPAIIEALQIAGTSPPGAVTWLFLVEGPLDAYEADRLREYGEVHIVSDKPKMQWWQYLRLTLDFRPHVAHADSVTFRGFAERAGLPSAEVATEEDERTWLTRYQEALYPVTDIVILAHDELVVTRSCVAHVLAHTWAPFRLVLVDNGSEEPVGEYFRTVAASMPEGQCLVLEPGENLGCPGGRDLAYHETDSPFFAWLDNDMLPPPGWLGPLVRRMQAQPEIGVIAPWAEIYALERRGRAPKKYDLYGANNLFRREAVAKAEEEAGTIHTEPFRTQQGRGDTDLMWRIKEAGFELWLDGEVQLRHLGGPLHSGFGQGLTRRTADKGDLDAANAAFYAKWSAPGVRRRRDGGRAWADKQIDPAQRPEKVPAILARHPAPGQRTICFVVAGGSPSGGTKAIWRLAHHFEEAGWFVEVSMQRGIYAPEWDNFSVVSWETVRDYYDVVVATFLSTRRVAQKMACRARIGLVQSDEPAWVEGRSDHAAWLELFELKGFREVVIADHMHQFSKKYGMDIIGQIMPGVDKYVFAPKADFAWRRVPGPPHLLVVTKGKHVPYDGHDYLIPALAELAGRYPDLVIDWLGYPPPEFPCEVRHHRTFEEHAVAKLYSEATVYVLASLIEGSPLTVREAMACGTAVVSTPTGVEDYATDGENIKLVPHRDTAAIVEAVSWLLDNPRDRQRIALAGLKEIKRHSWGAYADAFEAIIERELAASADTV